MWMICKEKWRTLFNIEAPQEALTTDRCEMQCPPSSHAYFFFVVILHPGFNSSLATHAVEKACGFGLLNEHSNTSRAKNMWIWINQ